MGDRDPAQIKSPPFLSGGGEMGERLRGLDWEALGFAPPPLFPGSLKVALSLCLSSDFPTCVYWGPELRLLYNDAWAAIPAERHPWALGRPAREVWADIWHIVEPQMRQVIETGQGFSTFNQLLPLVRGGQARDSWWNYSFTPLFDDQERVVGVLNQGHETTAAVLLERARKDEVDRLRELFELAPVAVALLRGPGHVFELANSAYLQLVDGRPVLGLSVAEALPETLPQGFGDLLDHVYATGESYRGSAVQLQLRDGGDPSQQHRRFVDFLYQPVRDADGRVSGILAIAIDVTDRESALQELREADRRKDVFLATLAHELRNPLAPIRNGLEVLKLVGGQDPRIAAARDMMERQTGHLVHLVDDLLDIGRISTGKLQLRRSHVLLHDILARAVESTSQAFEQKSQMLRISVAAEDCAIDGDPERLTQVFSNLLGNASKFTGAEGHIALTTERRGDKVCVVVQDDGVGIPQAALERVFDLFEQLGPPGSSSGGLGIGLSLVSQLVRMHGGTVQAWSEGPGRGSRFTVTLPLAADDARPVPDGAGLAAPPTSRLPRARRILVADDNADAGDSLGALLRLEGHDVQLVRDGAAAVEAVARERPDVVFMDVGMPVMDGLEAARRIRALPGGGQVRIVALTGWGQQGDRERVRSAGIDLHLVKPVEAAELRRALGE